MGTFFKSGNDNKLRQRKEKDAERRRMPYSRSLTPLPQQGLSYYIISMSGSDEMDFFYISGTINCSCMCIPTKTPYESTIEPSG